MILQDFIYSKGNHFEVKSIALNMFQSTTS